MNYKIIAAMSYNRVIGKNGEIPWHISEDFKHFKKTTMGHTIVFGRKTFDSVGFLPGRANVVLSRNKTEILGATVIDNLSKVSLLQGEHIFICGGAEIYKQILDLNLCSEIYLTTVKQTFEGDAFFPVFGEEFQLVKEIENNEKFMIQRFSKNHA